MASFDVLPRRGLYPLNHTKGALLLSWTYQTYAQNWGFDYIKDVMRLVAPNMHI
jgi:hypothetical protein